MIDKASYKCKVCGKTLDLNTNEDKPECCGMPMEKLPYCMTTDTAEHARTDDDGGPCDDGRAG
jgi:hypothetical protein